MPRPERSLRSTKGIDAIPSPPPSLATGASERRWLRGDGFT